MILLQGAMGAGIMMMQLLLLMLLIGVPLIAITAFQKIKARKQGEEDLEKASFADNVMTAFGSIIFAVIIVVILFLIIIFILFGSVKSFD